MKKLIQTLLLIFTFASIATTSTFARNGTLLGVVKQHIHYGNLQNLKTL